MTGEDILSHFSPDLSELYRKAKALAKRAGGVLSPQHMVIALIDAYGIDTPNSGAYKDDLTRYIGQRYGTNAVETVKVPKETQELFAAAVEHAKERGSDYASVLHFLETLAKRGLPPLDKGAVDEIKEGFLAALSKKPAITVVIPESLLAYGRNLSEEALSPNAMPVIGREREVNAIIETLCRRIKNNPLLIGKAGVGKTAVVRAVAARMGRGEVPDRLKGKIIFEILRSNLVSGAAYYGEIEKRVKEIVSAVKENPQIIIFIDEIHTIVAAGGKEGLGDVANLMKAALGTGEITVIGATTTEEYYRYFVQDEALARRFNPILIDEPTPEDTLKILLGLKPDFEKFHGVAIPDAVLENIVRLSHLFLPQRSFPDKAIDLLDRASAKAALLSQEALDDDLVSSTVSEMSGIPVNIVNQDPRVFYDGLTRYLRERVVGQDEAASRISHIIKITKLRLDTRPQRPDGVIAFVGPHGVGKKEMALAIAEYVYGSREKLIEFDMSQYSEEHHIAKLIGSPPGYVGFGQRGELAKAAQDNPHSVLYFRNIDLADPVVTRFLAECFMEGQFTDAAGRLISLSNNTVILTLSGEGYEITKKKAIGFARSPDETEGLSVTLAPILEEISPALDDILLFNPLSVEQLEEITKRKVSEQIEEIKKKWHTDVEIDPEIIREIAQIAYDSGTFGEQIPSLIQEKIMDPLVDAILGGEGGGRCVLSIENGAVSCRLEPKHHEGKKAE
ncbi:MAG: ATP-dependent Clp protease ATP-binding subunit [candidate division WOR-3 bacterium]